MATSLIKPDDYWTLWALIVSGTGLSIWLEQTYKWAARLSGPVVALIIAMILSNTGLMPVESAAYDFIGSWLVPLAIPLLLIRANLFKILRATGRMFICVHISTIGSLLGSVLAFWLLRGRIPEPDITHSAGIMAASYIGGSVNFFAVAQSYNVSSAVTNPLIVADNFVMAGFFVMILSIAASSFFRRHYPHPHSVDADASAAQNLAAAHWQRKGIGLLDVAKLLAFTFVTVAIANLAGGIIKGVFGDVSRASLSVQMLHTLSTNKYVLITATSLFLATVFSTTLTTINGPDEVGSYFLYLFLFAIGLPADLKAVLLQAPLYFVFCGIIASVNLAFTLGAGKLLRLPLEELMLGVNATLGGPPTAVAMSISCGWSRLVLPGLLVGIWGYVIGTPLGVMVIEWLKRG